MDNHVETASEPNEKISVISRYEMLLMLENWLEWQQSCGKDLVK